MIKVSTHDFDTKDLGVTLTGNTLTVSLGSTTKNIDLTPILPVVPEPVDYYLSTDSKYDPATKSLHLVSKAEGQPDKLATVSLQQLIDSIGRIQGEQGIAGAKGAKGDKGEKGDKGDKGEKGDKGNDGRDGTNGINGANGRDGVDGKSAYRIWRDLGNTGSEAEFILFLKGAKGDKGDRGVQGTAGVSAYDVWKKHNNNGSEQEFLASLKGEKGDDGNSSEFDLSNLPVVSWKNGTEILVKQDGKLKKLVPSENLFQEIGVALYGQKLSGNTGDTYHLVATVTNSSEAQNTLTDLVITKPLLGSYSIKNVRHTASTGARIEKINDLTYKVHNLGSGGTAKVEFDVIPTSAGTFQFGASVNPNTAFDKQSNNNQATITLSIVTPVDTTYVPTVDCPMLSFKDVATNKAIFMNNTEQANRFNSQYSKAKDQRINFYNGVNVIQLKSTQPVGTIVVYHFGPSSSGDKYFFVDSNNNSYIAGVWGWEGLKDNIAVDGSSLEGVSLSENNTKITINNATNKHFIIGVKPTGNNCSFQWICIVNPSARAGGTGKILALNSGSANKVSIINSNNIKSNLGIQVNNLSSATLVGTVYDDLAKTETSSVIIRNNGTYKFTVRNGTIPARVYSTGKFHIESSGSEVTVKVTNATADDNTVITVDNIKFELGV